MKPALLLDGYKVDHRRQYPKNVSLVYSNMTARGSRRNAKKVVFFGLQYLVKKYLIEEWNNKFFNEPKEKVIKQYKRRIDNYLGPDSITYEHLEKLHDLGYLPIRIKAVKEGTSIPLRSPSFTIVNTLPEFYWLTNYLETLISCVLWMPCTSATTAKMYRDLGAKWIQLTAPEDMPVLDFLFHDFSFRGQSSVESACISGAAHLLSHRGTDTIPAIDFLEDYYGADCEKELIGASVPATEHAVTCSWGPDSEEKFFNYLLEELYKDQKIVSVVSDTWSLPCVLTKVLPKLKDIICSRPRKLVVRPDSFWTGPPDCLCGFNGYHEKMKGMNDKEIESVKKGVVQSLYDLFGGTVSSTGYIKLDEHCGVIYGDSCTQEVVNEVMQRLYDKKFASTNVFYGIGSYTYQYVTRDTDGYAIKATYIEVNNEGQNIYKDPITDSGLKKSHCGLLRLNEDGTVKQQCTWEEEATGMLQTVFENGKMCRFQTLAEIRRLINA